MLFGRAYRKLQDLLLQVQPTGDFLQRPRTRAVLQGQVRCYLHRPIHRDLVGGMPSRLLPGRGQVV